MRTGKDRMIVKWPRTLLLGSHLLAVISPLPLAFSPGNTTPHPRYHFHSFYLDFSLCQEDTFQPPLWPSNPLTNVSSYFWIQLEGLPSKVLGDTRISHGKCSVLWTRGWEHGAGARVPERLWCECHSLSTL